MCHMHLKHHMTHLVSTIVEILFLIENRLLSIDHAECQFEYGAYHQPTNFCTIPENVLNSIYIYYHQNIILTKALHAAFIKPGNQNECTFITGLLTHLLDIAIVMPVNMKTSMKKNVDE